MSSTQNQQRTGPSKGQYDHVLGSHDFPVERERYHLYASRFCPFAHRVVLVREFKQLQDFITMDIVRPYPKGEEGWRFPKDENEYPGATPDSIFHSQYLNEIYRRDDPQYAGKFSVPVLWDKKQSRIVNNESADLMRQLNTAYNEYLAERPHLQNLTFYPEDLQQEIDAVNAWLVPDLNEGVYKAGFAPDQETYDKHAEVVFETLEKLSDRLSSHPGSPFILGKKMTEVDLKAYATLIRFDTVYVQHFKLNIGTIRHDFPVLNRYLKFLYWQNPYFKETTNFKHIKENYTKCQPFINPRAITPKGPRPDIEAWTEEDEKWYRGLEQDFDIF